MCLWSFPYSAASASGLTRAGDWSFSLFYVKLDYMDKPNLTLEEALESGVVSDRIEKHKGEFDIAPIGPIGEDAIKKHREESRQESISPYETAIKALHQGDTRLSQEHSENFYNRAIPGADNKGLPEKFVVRAVDRKRLDTALRPQKAAELPADPFEEVSEAINRARKSDK